VSVVVCALARAQALQVKNSTLDWMFSAIAQSSFSSADAHLRLLWWPESPAPRAAFLGIRQAHPHPVEMTLFVA
jgi:hypothetical protein